MVELYVVIFLFFVLGLIVAVSLKAFLRVKKTHQIFSSNLERIAKGSRDVQRSLQRKQVVRTSLTPEQTNERYKRSIEQQKTYYQKRKKRLEH